jgi:apolipoprotein D and lipocalin family protein
MEMTRWAAFTFALTFAGLSCTTLLAQPREPLKTVSFVDISSYMGVWYEIASYPQSFSKDCFNTSATYTLRGDGKVDVLNQCHKGSPDGPVTSARGVARVVNPRTNAELKVTFFWPFSGKYWIIELGDDYEYAVVSEPGRSTLWILSRTEEMDQAKLNGILGRLRDVHHMDLTRLKFTRG